MPTGTLISVEQYLATSYRPDCDYVDGRIEERNLGELDHSSLQTAITAFFYQRQKTMGYHGRCRAARSGVAHALSGFPTFVWCWARPPKQIFRTPPFLCVEILSPEDRMKRVKERIDDYLAMGVSYVWVLDPVRPASVRRDSSGRLPRIQG